MCYNLSKLSRRAKLPWFMIRKSHHGKHHIKILTTLSVFIGVFIIQCTNQQVKKMNKSSLNKNPIKEVRKKVVKEEKRELKKIKFKIKMGERVSDWCGRLERRKILHCRTIKEVAKNESYLKFDFISGKEYSLSRFEGLFPIGNFTIGLRRKKINTDRIKENTFLSYTETKKLIKLLMDKKQDRILRILKNSKRKKQKGFLNLRQSFILASIVEKETVSNKNYDLVASVFINRLRTKDRLGSCPTVEYALGYHRPFLLYSDLKINSPYNVYKFRGLPPTPIAFFSEDAFLSVYFPIKTNYFFFVYDWTKKKLKFAKTYTQHKKNARIARKNYIKVFGKENIHKLEVDKFYEH